MYEVTLYYGTVETKYGVQTCHVLGTPENADAAWAAIRQALNEENACSDMAMDMATMVLPEELVKQIKEDAIKEYLKAKESMK